MAGFLIDEDLPRSLAIALQKAGFSAEDVRDAGLRGKPDADVLKYAVSKGLALVSEDMGFSNILRFPVGTHSGIVVARFPNELSTTVLNGEIVGVLSSLAIEEIEGSLIIIEPGKIRIRRKK
jgi:predicted nuclease of predicted toxin-antitoxin system